MSLRDNLAALVEAEGRFVDCGACGKRVVQFGTDRIYGDGQGGEIFSPARRYERKDGRVHPCVVTRDG